jgi:hypothetical protein
MFTKKLKDTYDFALRSEPATMTASSDIAANGKDM